MSSLNESLIDEIKHRYMNGAEALDGNPLAAAYRADVGYLLSQHTAATDVEEIGRRITVECGFTKNMGKAAAKAAIAAMEYGGLPTASVSGGVSQTQAIPAASPDSVKAEKPPEPLLRDDVSKGSEISYNEEEAEEEIVRIMTE